MIIIPVVISILTIWFGVFMINLLSDGEMEVLVRSGRGLASRTDDVRLVMIATFLVFGLMFLIMFLTNRLLTKFVFSKIVQPLELLSSGVHHISEGDLDYRIDYTEQDEFKSVCEAFNNMGEQLKTSAQEIAKNEQNRKELFAGISHDLRSPLTSIQGFVEGLLDGVANTPEAQEEYLHIIKQKTVDINNMMTQLFLYSKMDMGNYPTNPEKIEIGQEINDFVSASREDFKVRGLSIETNGLNSEAYIYADPLQLRSVFANVLENSVKYKTKDSVQSIISCALTDDLVYITIEDDGNGVSEDALPKLFDAFYRTDASRNNPNQGSGLGLAIVAKALERMNGSISAENKAEGGLRMVITIPKMSEVE